MAIGNVELLQECFPEHLRKNNSKNNSKNKIRQIHRGKMEEKKSKYGRNTTGERKI